MASLGPGLAVEMLSPGRNSRDIISLKIPALQFCRKRAFPMGDTGWGRPSVGNIRRE